MYSQPPYLCYTLPCKQKVHSHSSLSAWQYSATHTSMLKILIIMYKTSELTFATLVDHKACSSSAFLDLQHVTVVAHSINVLQACMHSHHMYNQHVHV